MDASFVRTPPGRNEAPLLPGSQHPAAVPTLTDPRQTNRADKQHVTALSSDLAARPIRADTQQQRTKSTKVSTHDLVTRQNPTCERENSPRVSQTSTPSGTSNLPSANFANCEQSTRSGQTLAQGHALGDREVSKSAPESSRSPDSSRRHVLGQRQASLAKDPTMGPGQDPGLGPGQDPSASGPTLARSCPESVEQRRFATEPTASSYPGHPGYTSLPSPRSKDELVTSLRSASSPQLNSKPASRSKVYRKASLKTASRSLSLTESSPLTPPSRVITVKSGQAPVTLTKSDRSADESAESGLKVKWNVDDVRITCNPLSTPYPYSTPCQKTPKASTIGEQPQDDEPKGRSCGSFLPILSLIPQTVISFQYLSPKMKFSWWRNKIS